MLDQVVDIQPLRFSSEQAIECECVDTLGGSFVGRKDQSVVNILLRNSGQSIQVWDLEA